MDYARPETLQDAIALLTAQDWTLLAGGTDVYPATDAQALGCPVLDLTGIAALRGIATGHDNWRIGAMTTWSEIAAVELPAAFDGLQAAAREVGSIQIQNSATIGGNLCNASPAADGVPPLLVLNADVELTSPRGVRQVALADFIIGNRQTALAGDEIVSAVVIPKNAASGGSAFRKLGARKYLVISIAMVAVRLDFAYGRVADAAIAVGACSAVARRLPDIEAALAGRRIERLPDAIDPDAVTAALAPIDDIRGPASYREAAAVTLIRRAIDDVISSGQAAA